MNTQASNEHTEQSQPRHQIIANGKVIYTGDDWAPVFLEAGLNPEYNTIIHLEDGVPGAQCGPSHAPEALRDRGHYGKASS